jgi:cytoskeletal protein CcmA (bactofilin family)
MMAVSERFPAAAIGSAQTIMPRLSSPVMARDAAGEWYFLEPDSERIEGNWHAPRYDGSSQRKDSECPDPRGTGPVQRPSRRILISPNKEKIKEKSMKLYRHGETFIAPRGSFFDGNVKIDGNLILPPDTHVWGRLVVAGRLELGALSTVGGNVTSQNAIIGSRTKIKGPLVALENVTVCDRARVHSIEAGGDIVLRPGVRVGSVKSDETIYIYGKIKSGRLIGRNVKVCGN